MLIRGRSISALLGPIPLFCSVALVAPSAAFAEEGDARAPLQLQPSPAAEPAPAADDTRLRDRRDEGPKLGLVESPYGMAARTFLVGVTGQGTTAVDSSISKGSGALLLGVSPLNRLTLHAVAGRDENGNFSPVLSAHVRVLGSLEEGGALGVLAQYKAEGFTEFGGEVETGVTGGVRAGALTLSSNLIFGFGTEDKDAGEKDVEARLQAGYDLGGAFRVGAQGQVRRRVSGVQLLGGRNVDAIGGPQVMWRGGPLVLALSGGPSTVNVPTGVGAYGMLTVAALMP